MSQKNRSKEKGHEIDKRKRCEQSSSSTSIFQRREENKSENGKGIRQLPLDRCLLFDCNVHS